MESFASSVLELQTVLKNPPPANAPPSLKYVVSSLDLTILSRRAQLFAEISDDVLVGIEMFDIEMFSAHIEDWKTRVYEIGSHGDFITESIFVEIKSTTPEFEKKYKELTKIRQNYKKSSEVYEKKLQQYNEILAHHEKIRMELYHMKLKLQEICMSELKEDVEIILPFPTQT
jgi:hypothetical protein